MNDLDILSKLYTEKVIECEKLKQENSKLERNIANYDYALSHITHLVTTNNKVPKRIKEGITSIMTEVTY